MIMKLPSKFCPPSLLSVSCEKSTEVCFQSEQNEENEHKGPFSGPACSLSMCVCLMGVRRGHWVELRRSDSMKLYLLFHLFSSPTERRAEGWIQARTGGGEPKGVQEMNYGGFIEALCESAPSACIMPRQSKTGQYLCGPSSQRDLKRASPMSQASLQCGHCTKCCSDPLQDAGHAAVKQWITRMV